MTLACIMRLMPATPIAESRPAMVVGIRQTSSAISTVMLIGVPDPATSTLNIEKGSKVTTTPRKTMVSATSRMVRAISFGVFWRLAFFDHGNHAVDEGFARIDRDPDDHPVGQHAGAAGDGREVAAGFADDRGRFAGDGGFVDRGDAFDDFAIGRNGFMAWTRTVSPLTQIGPVSVPTLNHASVRSTSWPRFPSSGRAAKRPVPCCALRPAPRRNWRRGR
jgi:hypothetical protein